MTETTIITLTEYKTKSLPQADFPEEAARILWERYRSQVMVEPPSFKNNHRWQLTAQGWVGQIPLTPDLTLSLQPKVPLGNLFRMLEYAYDLDIRFLGDLVDCHSLADFYERLANVLALRVLERGRKGLHRAYLPRQERLPYVRGRLETRQAVATPGRVALPCAYEEQTADIPANQILAWTLFTIARSGRCSERVLPTIRRAYRTLQGTVTVQPPAPDVWQSEVYHRLNEDYQPLHALCRFFLEQTGPSHRLGERQMLPFLVDMSRLYEKFVARWLATHLPPEVTLKIQERVNLSDSQALHFDIDLVLYDAGGRPRCVLDTKYKAPTTAPAADDIHQMISYAHTKGCDQAVLIYPSPLPQPLDETNRTIRLRSLTFGLAGDLEQAGQQFLRAFFGERHVA